MIDCLKCNIAKEDMVLIAMPSFGGKAPAVAKHSIMPQYAANRPDESDKKQLIKFAEQITGKDTEVAFVPGNRPYKKSGGTGLVPKPTQNCGKCGRCAKECLVQVIESTGFMSDSQKCISYMRCVYHSHRCKIQQKNSAPG